MSKVINLFGGAGIGKTVLSAEVFAKMKKAGLKCELVQEWVKNWAYENKSISGFDQFYIVGKQIRKESFFYDKVDYIVTDSPVWLAAIYESIGTGTDYLEKHIAGFTEYAKTQGIEYYNFILSRTFAYEQSGRYQSEAEAKEIDRKIQDFLDRMNVEYEILKMDPELRADYIVSKFK